MNADLADYKDGKRGNGMVLQLRYSDITEPIIGAFYEVYNELGHGFLESVYREAMVIALRARG